MMDDSLKRYQEVKEQYPEGKKKFVCKQCKKELWLDTNVYEKAYKDQKYCLDCRQATQ